MSKDRSPLLNAALVSMTLLAPSSFDLTRVVSFFGGDQRGFGKVLMAFV